MLQNQTTSSVRFSIFALVTTFTLTFGFPSESRGQAASSGAASKPSFTLSVTASDNDIKIGAAVQVDVTMKNISSQTIEVWRNALGQEGLVYEMNVTDERGAAPLDTKFGKDIKGLKDPAFLTPDTPIHMSGGWVTLKPGETLTDRLNISKLYNLAQPGKFAIQVRRFDDESKTFVKSNSISVTIHP